MGVCLLGNQSRLKSSSSILRNSQVVLQGTEQVARSQSEKPLTSSEGSVTRDYRRLYVINPRKYCLGLAGFPPRQLTPPPYSQPASTVMLNAALLSVFSGRL